MLKLKDCIFHVIHADLTKDNCQDVVKKWKFFYAKLNNQYYSKLIAVIFFCTDDLLFSTYWEGPSVCRGWGHHRYVPSDWLSGQLQNPHYLVPNYILTAMLMPLNFCLYLWMKVLVEGLKSVVSKYTHSEYWWPKKNVQKLVKRKAACFLCP